MQDLYHSQYLMTQEENPSHEMLQNAYESFSNGNSFNNSP